MRLYEFDNQNSLVNKIVIVTDQLKTDINDNKVSADWTIDDLLKYFQKYDVILDKTDLYNMSQKQPLKSVLKIEGDNIVFKDKENPDIESQPGESEKVIQQMAQHALKK